VQPEEQALGDEDDEADVVDNTDSMPVLELGNDDLQQIKGVGAKLEQKLNMLGITNFRSLVDLTPEDYEQAHKLIPSLQSRIKRDKWMSQARSLHKEKYNEAL
jgi:predicted flap endonuclease-1-like 5' DNA nuclease